MTMGTLGGNDGANYRGAGRNGDGEIIVISVLHHCRDQHGSETAYVGNGCSGDSREHHTGHDIYQGKAACVMSQKGITEI